MTTTLAIVDSHSHMYDLTRIGPFLKTAHANFSQTASSQGLGERWDGFLFCADLQGKSSEAVLGAIDSVDYSGVDIRKTDEACSRIVTVDGSENRLFLVMGYQIICQGDLEVLAYGLDQPVGNGMSVSETLQQTLSQNALTILPWGFGKWWFQRGKLIDGILDGIQQSSGERGRVFVADNGGRVFWSWVPALIRKAVSLKIWNLVGSDPLPFAAQAMKAGRTASILTVNLKVAEPLASLQSALSSLDAQPKIHGTGERLLSFVISQVRMQMLKRLRQ